MKNKKKYIKPTVKEKTLDIASFGNYSRFNDSLYGIENYNLLAYTSCSSCVLPGSQVLIEGMTTKSIEKLLEGDYILSYDVSRESLTRNRISKKIHHKDNKYGYYLINKTLKITNNHLIWVNNHAWRRVEALKIGDTVFSPEGKLIEVISLQKVLEVSDVYNLALEYTNHNYFCDNILIHNGDSSDLLAGTGNKE